VNARNLFGDGFVLTRIKASAILDTTAHTETRTSDQLPKFLEQFAGERRSKKGSKLLNAPEAKSSPHTLVVAGGGQRAADVARALRKFQTKDCMVAKLFAKHIKLKEAVETVKKSRMGMGVGTPQRIIDLLEDGALKTDCIERIVIDASHIDTKKRGILDMKETQVPLVTLLTRADLKERFGTGEGKIELLFF
jgi:protein CMS1